jgi:hypothetical protein
MQYKDRNIKVVIAFVLRLRTSHRYAGPRFEQKRKGERRKEETVMEKGK